MMRAVDVVTGRRSPRGGVLAARRRAAVSGGRRRSVEASRHEGETAPLADGGRRLMGAHTWHVGVRVATEGE